MHALMASSSQQQRQHHHQHDNNNNSFPPSSDTHMLRPTVAVLWSSLTLCFPRAGLQVCVVQFSNDTRVEVPLGPLDKPAFDTAIRGMVRGAHTHAHEQARGVEEGCACTLCLCLPRKHAPQQLLQHRQQQHCVPPNLAILYVAVVHVRAGVLCAGLHVCLCRIPFQLCRCASTVAPTLQQQ